METLHQLYYDPFAENGQELFDPIASFAALEARYTSDEVQHDTAADEFVRGTEALMLDAAFIQRFDAVQAMAARLHQLCGDDHSLSQLAQTNETLSNALEAHNANDGHEHHKKDSDDDYEVDPKTGKRIKKKKRASWFALLLKS